MIRQNIFLIWLFTVLTSPLATHADVMDATFLKTHREEIANILLKNPDVSMTQFLRAEVNAVQTAGFKYFLIRHEARARTQYFYIVGDNREEIRGEDFFYDGAGQLIRSAAVDALSGSLLENELALNAVAQDDRILNRKLQDHLLSILSGEPDYLAEITALNNLMNTHVDALRSPAQIATRDAGCTQFLVTLANQAAVKLPW